MHHNGLGRITILAHGSRGDVQPYLALALGLAQAGHTVRLAAPGIFRAMVETAAGQRGLAERVRFLPLSGDPIQLMRRAASPGVMRLLPTPLRMGVTTLAYVRPVIRELIREAREASRDADLVIHTLLTTVLGHLAAREAGARDLSALVFPVFAPTTDFPNPLFPEWPHWAEKLGPKLAGFGPRYNFLTHREFNRVYWQANRLAISWLRQQDPGLGPLAAWPFAGCDGFQPRAEQGGAKCPTPILYGISPTALPRPSLWGPNHLQTGYWFLDSPGYHPPEALIRFLEAGPPPVFVGFGSLIPKDAGRLAAIAVQALERSGQRGVLLAGWSGMPRRSLPETVYPLEEAPFDWLFPRVAVAVHHGGVGTTAAALRAGIPSVVVPFAFDQPFWGRQVAALGAGTPPIAPRSLNPERLAQAIEQAVEDETIRKRVEALGESIRQEDGVGEAVKVIEGFLF